MPLSLYLLFLACFLLPACCFLKVQPQGQVCRWLSFKESIHLPGYVETEEVSQKGASGTKSISACKWPDATSLYAHQHTGSGLTGVDHIGSFEGIIGAVPCSTQVEELDQLEIAQEGIVDRFIEQGAE